MPAIRFAGPNGLEADQAVIVSATDPVAGTLVYQGAEEIVISREDERVGRVQVHFPRLGFRIG